MSYSKTETETIADPNEVAQRVAKLKLTGGNVLGKSVSICMYSHLLQRHSRLRFAGCALPSLPPCMGEDQVPRLGGDPIRRPRCTWNARQEALVWRRRHFTPDHSFTRRRNQGKVKRGIDAMQVTDWQGVQLSQLSKEGRDDLALLAAERGVLIL